jgi:signal transduction histidine kinase
LAPAEVLAGRCAGAVLGARRMSELETALQAQRQFLAVAAHELRGPLAGVIGAADLLRRHTTKQMAFTERQRQALHMIDNQATHLRHLVDTLLDVSRVGSGQLAILRHPIDLAALMRQVVAEIQPFEMRHTLTVSSPGEPMIVDGDYQRLTQVLRNLIQKITRHAPAPAPGPAAPGGPPARA